TLSHLYVPVDGGRELYGKGSTHRVNAVPHRQNWDGLNIRVEVDNVKDVRSGVDGQIQWCVHYHTAICVIFTFYLDLREDARQGRRCQHSLGADLVAEISILKYLQIACPPVGSGDLQHRI